MLGLFLLAGAAGLLAFALFRVRAIPWWLAVPVVLSQLFLPAFFRSRESYVFGIVWVALGLALAVCGRSREKQP
jgi:hypothetical protein